MTENDLKSFLDFKSDLYNRQEFIPEDPVSVPHLFHRKEDIEIAGFLTAVISWGQRKTIIANARKWMSLMDDAPFDYVMNSSSRDQKDLLSFVHRTFNGEDCLYFVQSLRHLYQHCGGLENVMGSRFPEADENVRTMLSRLKQVFFESPHLPRTVKHLPDPMKGSAAKRMNMFLRWMVRKDDRGVDFGLWNRIGMDQLLCPLDVHSGYVARNLGLLSRKQNDWKAVEELTARLRRLDPADPVRYDYALFGIGMYESF
ncbi:MAG TPA: TIGR02757 family protein [Bacteroidales bacterium]|nr:TIGR02757 family protein [Bacteroidales bacterium]